MGTFDKKPRGRKGEGRAVLFKPVNLPVDVLEDLRLFKNIYEIAHSEGKDQWGNPVPTKLSYGQVLTHWMENVESFDPEIAGEFGIVCLARGNDSCREIIQNDPFLKTIAADILLLETPDDWKGISSTAVREAVRQMTELEKKLDGMVPEEIRGMLKKEGKYT